MTGHVEKADIFRHIGFFMPTKPEKIKLFLYSEKFYAPKNKSNLLFCIDKIKDLKLDTLLTTDLDWRPLKNYKQINNK